MDKVQIIPSLGVTEINPRLVASIEFYLNEAELSLNSINLGNQIN